MKYRKKSVIIDAWPCELAIKYMSWRRPGGIIATVAHPEGEGLYDAIARGNIGPFIILGDDPKKGGKYVVIETLEGNHSARHDDMIIMGIAGEFYPCKPDIFEATYEMVDPKYDYLSSKKCPTCGNAGGVENA